MKKNPRRRNTYRLVGHDYSDSSHVYFVTLDSKIKAVEDDSRLDPARPFVSCPDLAEQVVQGLLFYRERGDLLVFAYCLMPDHLHLLIAPQDGMNLSSLLGSYQSYVTRISWNYGVVGRLWRRSFYDHVLRRSEDALKIAAYILDNPVRAGLVRRWEEWRWCGVPDAL